MTRITAEVKVLDSYTLKIDRLAYALKWIRQAAMQEDIVYDPSSRSIKDQLILWIGEEMVYLREMLQYHIPFGGGQEQPVQRDYKLHMNITVAQLACLLRAMVETGVIQNKNIMELARFIPEIVKVKQKESFSPVSFRLKYYNVEEGTNQSVIGTLRRLIESVSKFG